MELKQGENFSAVVTGLTKFGAFVTLPSGESGMVHISQVSNSYVEDINSCLTVGQDVKVKFTGANDNGKLSFSIKQAMERPKYQAKKQNFTPVRENWKSLDNQKNNKDNSFEDKLKSFMQDSENKVYEMKREKRTNTRRK